MKFVVPLKKLHFQVIEGCIQEDRRCQKVLYEHYYGIMLSVCQRYARDDDEAIGMLNEGFVKVFRNLSKFRPESSLDSWIKRIMINNAIDHYRKNKKHKNVIDIDEVYNYAEQETIHANLNADQLMTLVQQLPPAYKMVFSLFAIEGWNHKQIAEQLNISEGTSKSNLSKARKKLQKMLFKLNGENGKFASHR